jgi:threonine/homoserine/homoserine lactone efflux protein
MDTLMQYGGGLVIGLVAAMSPGPDTILVLRSVMSGGTRAGVRTALGIGSALVVHAILTLVLVGLAREVATVPALKAVQLAGALYLGYLGMALASASLEGATGQLEGHDGAGAVGNYFAQGLITNLTNPKAIVFFGSVVSQFISSHNISAGAAVMLGIITAVPVWFLLLSFGSARFLTRLSSRWRRAIDLVAAMLFLVIAGGGIALLCAG